MTAGTEDPGSGSACLAECLGIEGGHNPSLYVFGAAVATRTRRLRISSGVAVAPFDHPVRVAEGLAVPSNISNGRVGFVQELSCLPRRAGAYGFAPGHRGRMADKLLAIGCCLRAGEAVDFSVEFCTISGARRGFDPTILKKCAPAIALSTRRGFSVGTGPTRGSWSVRSRSGLSIRARSRFSHPIRRPPISASRLIRPHGEKFCRQLPAGYPSASHSSACRTLGQSSYASLSVN